MLMLVKLLQSAVTIVSSAALLVLLLCATVQLTFDCNHVAAVVLICKYFKCLEDMSLLLTLSDNACRLPQIQDKKETERNASP